MTGMRVLHHTQGCPIGGQGESETSVNMCGNEGLKDGWVPLKGRAGGKRVERRQGFWLNSLPHQPMHVWATVGQFSSILGQKYPPFCTLTPQE